MLRPHQELLLKLAEGDASEDAPKPSGSFGQMLDTAKDYKGSVGIGALLGGGGGLLAHLLGDDPDKSFSSLLKKMLLGAALGGGVGGAGQHYGAWGGASTGTETDEIPGDTVTQTEELESPQTTPTEVEELASPSLGRYITPEQALEIARGGTPGSLAATNPRLLSSITPGYAQSLTLPSATQGGADTAIDELEGPSRRRQPYIDNSMGRRSVEVMGALSGAVNSNVQDRLNHGTRGKLTGGKMLGGALLGGGVGHALGRYGTPDEEIDTPFWNSHTSAPATGAGAFVGSMAPKFRNRYDVGLIPTRARAQGWPTKSKTLASTILGAAAGYGMDRAGHGINWARELLSDD